MKNIIMILISVVTFAMLQSCEKMGGGFLDKAPGVDVTEDTIFTSKVQAETFIATLYRYGVHSVLPRNETSRTGSDYGMDAAACDEAESAANWISEQDVNSGLQDANNISWHDGQRWPITWKAIRWANILMQHIDDVPGIDQAYIDQVKGEARFIRALNYFEMLKRYGGVQIIDKNFNLSDDLKIPRNTVKEVVDFIIADCDAAALGLPDVYPTNLRGRATKGAALMLKSRTLLYAASPLFNTGTPYLDMADPSKNNLICYGNYDVNRWQLAADAAKAVIDWAPSGSIGLVTDQGIDKNYRYVFETNDNSEIIFANKSTGKTYNWEFPWTSLIPNQWYAAWTWGMGYSMPVNFLRKYEKQDGTPQVWDPVGGVDLIQKYNELDRRFKQSVAVAGSYWNVDIPMVNSYSGGTHYSLCTTGQWITKFIPPSLTNSANRAMANDIIFRFGEAYLNYAEALNEAQGPVPDAYTAVNIIRARSGQPDLPVGLTKEQFRDRVRNERAIELYYEGHRYFDIMRWLIAEQDGVMKGSFYGFKIYQNPAPPNFRYETYQFEIRSFNKKEYLYPFYRSEVLKGYLIQNPGW